MQQFKRSLRLLQANTISLRSRRRHMYHTAVFIAPSQRLNSALIEPYCAVGGDICMIQQYDDTYTALLYSSMRMQYAAVYFFIIIQQCADTFFYYYIAVCRYSSMQQYYIAVRGYTAVLYSSMRMQQYSREGFAPALGVHDSGIIYIIHIHIYMQV